MKISDFDGGDYYIGGGPMQDKKLRLEPEAFRFFLEANWDLASWEYFGPQQTRLTHYRFMLRLDLEDGTIDITGRMNENEWRRVQLDLASPQFAALFTGRLSRAFPDNTNIKVLVFGMADAQFDARYSEAEILAMSNDEIFARVLIVPDDFRSAISEIE